VSVIIPVKNEARNLPRCLESVRNFADVHVIDSGSTDETCQIANSYGAQVVQFRYRGGWPKKRQWAMDNLSLACNWVLLIDADEVITTELEREIRATISNPERDGYYIPLQMHFLGRRLRHSDARFWKLSLFRRGRARFECRLKDQDASMADMEVHEHVICDGSVGELRNPLTHCNVESLERFIQKHNEYSNWEAQVWSNSVAGKGIEPDFWGTQAQRRRWLRQKFLFVPGFPVLFFVYKYFLRLGLLDGIPGLIYCGMQSVQFFHIKAKIYELKTRQTISLTSDGATESTLQ
jgi:glycosyltransferase involved in cell wall biosynthesis